jgi:predicted DsbA family dithiol-disulfide isomerase
MITLDVYADIVCPWCFIGKAHLNTVLRERDDVVVRHRPFLLDPHMPRDGLPFQEHLAAKLGGEGRMHAAMKRVAEHGKSAGVELRFDKIIRSPNTLLAHRLVWLAKEREPAMLDALYRAHFTEGLDVGDPATLERLGHSVFGDDGAVESVTRGNAGAAEVAQLLAEARALGVNGVPLFVANGETAVSGAQPPEVLREFLDDVSPR